MLAILRPCAVSLGALWVPSSWCIGSYLVAAGIVAVPRGSWGAVGSPKNCGAETAPRGRAGGGRAGCGEGGSPGPGSCASHPVAFVAAAVCSIARGQSGSQSLLPASPPPAGTSGADSCAAPGAPSPIKASRGVLQRTQLAGNGGFGGCSPGPSFWSWAQLCRACFWHSSFTGRAKGAGLLSKSSASPMTTSSNHYG